MVLALTLAGCGGGGGSGGGGSSLFAPSTTDTTTVTPTAASITLDLGGVSSITNNGNDKITATVTAKNASNVVVAGVPVSISSDSGDVAVTGTVTDSSGKLTATITVGQNKSNRTVRVTATSGTLSQSRTFAITGSRITATAVPSVIAPSASGQIQYQVVDVNGNPLADLPITISSTLGSTTAATSSNGTYTYVYAAPASAGDLVVTATAAGVSHQDTVTVQAVSGGSKPDVTAGSIQSASVEANPSVVTVNESGSSSNTSAIRALFTGANNASIQNVRVRFDLAGDTNSIGGTFAAGSSIVYSNANGEASTFYVPGSKASPTNGVTVRACYGYTDAELAGNACPNQVTTNLTVASGAVSVSIGTNNLLIELNNGLQLAQDFVVTVNDSAGRAKSGVDVVPSVDLISYAKGKYRYGTFPVTNFDGSTSSFTGWGRFAPQDFSDVNGNVFADGSASGACWNEDRNRNNIREASEDSTSVTYSALQGGNGNGILDPAKSDVVITVNGGTSAKTDSTGSANVRISYQRNLAGWLKYNILVSAGGVSGTEGRANWIDILKIPNADIKAETEPAWVKSRYGELAGCQNPN